MSSVGTEAIDAQYADLDLRPSAALARAFIDDQQQAVAAAQAVAPALGLAIDDAVARLRVGGRLVYFGAGTSGRLAVLDCVELGPTFSWPAHRRVAHLAGGNSAMFESVEGAEDDRALAEADFARENVTATDVVISVAASGRTPYALAALEAARRCGALAIAVVNNTGSPMAAVADHALVLDTGPEVIAGSTRLKAGTAQKIVLNTLSSGIMVKLEKVHGNLMVDMRASNDKLMRRAVALTARLAEVDNAAAQTALQACAFELKTAIVGLRRGADVAEARTLLDEHGGSVRRALNA